MFKLSLTLFLVLSISANYVFTNEVFQADTTNLQNESLVGVLKNNNQTKESPTKLHEETSQNDTKITSTLEKDQLKDDILQGKKSNATSLVRLNITTLSTQNVNQNLTKLIEETPPTIKKVVTQKTENISDEQTNRNSSSKDNKDVVTMVTSKENTTTTNSTLKTTSSSIVDSLNSTTVKPTNPDHITAPPDFYPVKGNANENSNITDSLNGSIYKTFPPELDNVTEATTLKISNSTGITTSITNTTTLTTPTTPTVVTVKSTPVTKTTSDVTTPPTTPVAVINSSTTTIITMNTTGATNISNVSQNNNTKNGNDRTIVEGVGDLQKAKLSEKVKESNDENKNKSMPPGIIALVTAITFAVAIAIGYISMVVWKHYLEHRYGRRELLVNELEFDTNDLRHFEL